MIFSLWWSFWEHKPVCSCVFLEAPMTPGTPQHGWWKFRYGVTPNNISSQFSLAYTNLFNVGHCVTSMELLRAGKGQRDSAFAGKNIYKKNFLWAPKTRKPAFLVVCIVSCDLVWIFWCAVSGMLQHVPSFCENMVITASCCNVFLCRGYRSKSLHASTLPEERQRERKREES